MLVNITLQFDIFLNDLMHDFLHLLGFYFIQTIILIEDYLTLMIYLLILFIKVIFIVLTSILLPVKGKEGDIGAYTLYQHLSCLYLNIEFIV